MIAQTPNNSWS